MRRLIDPPICSIIPPHIFDRLSQSGDPELEATAERSLQITARLRAQRSAAGLLAAAVATKPGILTRQIYSAGNIEALPGNLVRSEGDPATGDIPSDQAYDGAGLVWTFYKNVFSRDSLDNHGMRLDSTVHYGAGYDNAFWNGTQMVYGDGDGQLLHNFTSALDVIGHEMTHGVTQNESALAYQGESGALNEHLSDVFGILVKQQDLGQDAGSADWLIGVGLLIPPNPMPPGATCRALRDMLNPGTAYRGLPIGDDPQPATYAGLYTGPDDNGGVHINSGIPNKVFATYAIAVGGNAWEAPGQVWYKAATGMGLPSTADFAAFKDITLQAAQQIAPATVAALRNAWSAVGV
jgi:Zn-dependent metalloprotease